MGQQSFTFEAQITRPIRLNYLLYLPKNYGVDPKQKWPLILFLHGADERGDNPELIKLHGIPKVVDQREDFPFITVSPQCPRNTWWIDHVEALNTLLDAVCATHAVDLDRVYLTGISMGGYGTWLLAVEHQDRFAAIAPICGGGLFFYGFPERVCELKKMPTWVFHGAKDDTVPLRESEVMVEALRACGGSPRFTIYPDADHVCWPATYDDPELYDWFLSHTLSGRLSQGS